MLHILFITKCIGALVLFIKKTEVYMKQKLNVTDMAQ